MSFVRVKNFTPYHQDYGLTDELRLRVIDDAQAMFDWLIGKADNAAGEEQQQDKAPF